MKILSSPAGLRWSAAALFLSVPLAVFESAIISQLPLRQMPHLTLGVVAGVAFLLSLVLSIVIFKIRTLATRLLAVAFFAWFIFNAGFAIHMKFPSLGLFSLFIVPLCAMEWVWVRRELGRSFLDPQLKWYEGAPIPIPGLSCEWVDPELGVYPFEVSRLDTRGTLVFRRNPLSSDLVGKRKRVQLKFQFKDQDLNLNAVPRLYWERHASGMGLQFQHLSPDEKKNLADFVEMLKGEGYVG